MKSIILPARRERSRLPINASPQKMKSLFFFSHASLSLRKPLTEVNFTRAHE